MSADGMARIAEAVREARAAAVSEGVRAALADGAPAEQIVTEGLVAGMGVVGDLFKAGDLFVAEVLASARAMKAGMALLEPLLKGEARERIGTVVLGTVRGDLHDIGKKLVGVMLEAAGFAVVDLGTDVAPERFVEEVKARGAQIVGLSALLTTTMRAMKDTIDALARAGLRDRVKVLVGGAAVSAAFAAEIGADGTAPDAGGAVALAKQLVARLRISDCGLRIEE